jgi:uncharacterized RDD family membrane protein YckC
MSSAVEGGSLPGLPHPETGADFYDGVPLRRFVAWCVDVTVVLAIGGPIALVFGLVTLGMGFAAFPLILAGVGLLYRTATISGRSATWGMRATGIELRRHDGARFDPLTALLHALGYLVCITVLPLQLVSCATILATPYRQSLPDLFLRTAMINRPVP